MRRAARLGRLRGNVERGCSVPKEKDIYNGIDITDSAVIVGRTELSLVAYEAAKEHRDKAVAFDGKDMSRERSESLQAILLAATASEGYINACARSHLSDQDWAKYEKGSPEAKWKGIPRRVTGKTLNLNRAPLDFFGNLWEIRHYIVHFKADMLPFVQTKYGRTAPGIDKLNAENAKKACALIPALIEALKRLDPSKAVPWEIK